LGKSGGGGGEVISKGGRPTCKRCELRRMWIWFWEKKDERGQIPFCGYAKEREGGGKGNLEKKGKVR